MFYVWLLCYKLHMTEIKKKQYCLILSFISLEALLTVKKIAKMTIKVKQVI